MASPATPPAAAPSPSVSCGSCCSGQALAYLFLRVMLALILILAGIEKFKSSAIPYTYSRQNWHGIVQNGEVVEGGRWLPIAKVVFEKSGLNNEDFFGPKVSKTVGWAFYRYMQVLPYAMIAVGFFILIGFLNRISLFLGACIWLSLAIGQAMLPDNPTAMMLFNYAFFNAAALAIVKYNRFAVTRF